MLWNVMAFILFLMGAYYSFQDLSCDRPQAGVGLAAGVFFIAAILCLK